MLGKGGKTIGDFVRRDIPVIQRYRPDILILLLGDNDIGCDTSAEEIANHLVALSPFLTGRMFVQLTMIRFLIELLVRRIWFGQSKL